MCVDRLPKIFGLTSVCADHSCRVKPVIYITSDWEIRPLSLSVCVRVFVWLFVTSCWSRWNLLCCIMTSQTFVFFFTCVKTQLMSFISSCEPKLANLYEPFYFLWHVYRHKSFLFCFIVCFTSSVEEAQIPLKGKRNTEPCGSFINDENVACHEKLIFLPKQVVEFGQVIQNFSVMYKICIMQGITSKLKLKIYLLCKYLFNVLLLKL